MEWEKMNELFVFPDNSVAFGKLPSISPSHWAMCDTEL